MSMTLAQRALNAQAIRAATLAAVENCGLRRPLERLLERLGPGTAAYLVGGAPRDAVRSLLTSAPVPAKDADVVIATRGLADALAAMPGRVTMTALGGFRWSPPKTRAWIDVWELHSTPWIRRLDLPVTLEAFLAGVDLNVDRIAVALHTEEVRDAGCVAALHRAVIDLDAAIRLDELEAAELARAVRAHLATGYRLADRVHADLRRADAGQLHRAVFERLRSDGYRPRALAAVWRFIERVRPAIAAPQPVAI